MKFRFIGKEPMTTHGIGITRPGEIIDVRDPKRREEVKKSSLFVQVEEKQKSKPQIIEKQKEDKIEEEE